MTETEPDDLDQLTVTMTVSEIESARDVLVCLNEAGASVEPASVDMMGPRKMGIQIDLSGMTTKQWETLVLAYDQGYYERPRETDLSELATELSISKSAVSQRLRGAQGALVESVITGSRSKVPEEP